MTATTIFFYCHFSFFFFFFSFYSAPVFIICSASRKPVVCLFVNFSLSLYSFFRGLDMGTRCSPISPFYAFAPGYVSILVGIA
jgi:hypothetical protein